MYCPSLKFHNYLSIPNVSNPCYSLIIPYNLSIPNVSNPSHSLLISDPPTTFTSQPIFHYYPYLDCSESKNEKPKKKEIILIPKLKIIINLTNLAICLKMTHIVKLFSQIQTA